MSFQPLSSISRQEFLEALPSSPGFCGSSQPTGEARGGRAGERPRTRFAKLNLSTAPTCVRIRRLACLPHCPRGIPRPHCTITCGSASRVPPRSSLSSRPPRASLSARCRESAPGWRDRGQPPGRAARCWEPAGGARPGESAPSRSERASGAGGAICNRADATTAPYSRGAGAGGQVTAAHPTPRSRVVPAQEEPPGAL